jgi:hypothetical protein
MLIVSIIVAHVTALVYNVLKITPPPRNEWIVFKTTKIFPTYALLLEYMLLDGINFEPKRLITKFQTPLITTKTVDISNKTIKEKYNYIHVKALINY